MIAAWQAESAGLAPRQIESLVRYGRWQRLHHGVFATFTGQPSRAAQLWAAVLRGGPQAVLSHETAAELDRLNDRASPLIHVTIPASRRVSPVPGLVFHRSARLPMAANWNLRPPRTVLDETVLDLIQEAAGLDDAIALLARACQRGLTTPEMLALRLGTRRKARWRAEIEEALADVCSGVHSILEYRYRWSVERPHGLPRAERQARAAVGGRAVYRDVLYRRYAVVVELDGRAYHSADTRWRDHRRDNAAAADGACTLRYGWADVTERACETAAEVGAVLGLRGWPGPLGRCGSRCGALLS